MKAQHDFVDRKAPVHNAHHMREELYNKSPSGAPGDRHAHDEHHQDHDHHAHMVADFRRRFWVSLVLTLPILILSPMLQKLLGLPEAFHFSGDLYVLFFLSSAIFFYGGWPFLSGLFDELKSRQPGMMTLIAIAIAKAYFYSCAVVFGLSGKTFFWELATLVDIMLLGHWIEMKSVWEPLEPWKNWPDSCRQTPTSSCLTAGSFSPGFALPPLNHVLQRTTMPPGLGREVKAPCGLSPSRGPHP